MKQTKIDWCDCTINPVVGCKNNCKYCYANKINKRFHFVPDFRHPQFFPERLQDLNSKTPKSIFMDSMSDIGYWDTDWIYKTYARINLNRQHKYIFLTKSCGGGVRVFIEMRDIDEIYCEQVIYIGRTIDNNKEQVEDHYDFYSIEPILEPIDISFIKKYKRLQLVIIGAETGNRKGKVIPEKWWIDDIVRICDKNGVKVFMKASLRGIMGKDFRQDKLPWEIEK